MRNENRDLTLEVVQDAVRGTATAFRCVTEYQPAGGPGTTVFPPTYERGQYAVEKRRIEGEAELSDCVLLDSVQSQANRMEEALRNTWEESRISLPVITADFDGFDLPKVLRITSLDAPHRIADAILRDSLLDDTPFRKSELGKRLDNVDTRNAMPLYEMCPTALVFGMWDSTGPRGGGGAKFARAMVSEIVGIDAQFGKKTSSRIDPAQIQVNAGPLFENADGSDIEWTLDAAAAKTDKKGQPVLYNRGKEEGKAGNPSKANHGNVTPTFTIAGGGVTIRKAVQTTVLSLPALRRLRFPLDGKHDPKVDNVARTVLAALGLCAAALVREQGCDLRSRCLLHATERISWELLDKPGDPPQFFSLTADQAIAIFNAAVQAAKKAKLPWMEKELILTPSRQLAELVKKSQELAAKMVADEEDE